MTTPPTMPTLPHSWNVPNSLTVTRIVLTVPLVVCYLWECYTTALAIFIIASLTDWVDGWWARRFGQISVFGRITDPLADKLLVCTLFILFAATDSLHAVVPAWVAVIIVARELIVTSLRSVVENRGGDFSAKWIGKWKMGLQCIASVAIFLFLLRPSQDFIANLRAGEWLDWLLASSLGGAVVLTIWSGISYTIRAIQLTTSAGELPHHRDAVE